MTNPTNQSLYSTNSGVTFSSPPEIRTRNPVSTDISGGNGIYQLGQRWVNSSSNTSFTLTSFNASASGISATWTQEGGSGSGTLDELAGDTGTASPSSGSITIEGGPGITTSASGSTVTVTSTGVFTLSASAGGAAFPNGGDILLEAGTGITTTASGDTITIAATATSQNYPFAVVTSVADGVNVTGDGTFWYLSTVGGSTLNILYDAGSAVAIGSGTAVFTAPVEGIYYFNWDVCMAGVGAAHTKMDMYVEVNSVDNYLGYIINPYNLSEPGGALAINSSCQIELNASDTVRVKFAVYNGTKVVSVYGSSTDEFARCSFSGYLIQ